jgi:hypothetical protein
MALASGLVTAVDDQEQAAASLSNAARRRCYLRLSIAIGSNPMDGSATETGPSSWLEQPAGFAPTADLHEGGRDRPSSGSSAG